MFLKPLSDRKSFGLYNGEFHDRTYLFDLDFNRGDQNLYTVDAAFYGNLSHFINHRSGLKYSSNYKIVFYRHIYL